METGSIAGGPGPEAPPRSLRQALTCTVDVTIVASLNNGEANDRSSMLSCFQLRYKYPESSRLLQPSD